MGEFLKGVWGVCLYCGEGVGKVDVEEEGVEGVRVAVRDGVFGWENGLGLVTSEGRDVRWGARGPEGGFGATACEAARSAVGEIAFSSP